MVGIAYWRFCPGEHSPSCTAVNQVSAEIRRRFTAIAYTGIAMTRRIMTFFGIAVKAFFSGNKSKISGNTQRQMRRNKFEIIDANLDFSCNTKK